MRMTTRGFTLVELVLVITILGIIAAIVSYDFLAMRERAKDVSTKANMHAFQLAAEDYSARNHGAYAGTADAIAVLLPGEGSAFRNPFDRSTGNLGAWKDVASFSESLATGSTVPGIVAYSDSATLQYVIAGRGGAGDLPLHLTSGR